MTTITQALTEFATASKADGIKPSTLKWYAAMLKGFNKHMGAADVAAVSTQNMRGFVNSIRERYCATTATDHIIALRRFWSWCADEYNVSNPMQRIRQPKRPKPNPKAIAPEDFKKLYAACDESPVGYRNRAVLVLLADTGIRAAGLLGLTPDDIDFARRRATVREKGDKTRTVPFVPYTAHVLTQWMKHRPLNATAVFCRADGAPLTYWGLRELLRRLAAKAGVSARHNLHSFRHFAAREYLRQGGDLATLATLLGHADVSTTANHYTIYDSDEIAARHDAHSPLKSLFNGKDGSI
jgi:site-specific recombinase XerD